MYHALSISCCTVHTPALLASWPAAAGLESPCAYWSTTTAQLVSLAGNRHVREYTILEAFTVIQGSVENSIGFDSLC
jgi:hypothetical protein